MLLLIIILSNFAAGIGLGTRFGVLILIPIMPAVVLELAVFEYVTADVAWAAVIWHATALIAALDLGYLAGLAIRGRFTAQREAVVSA